MFILSGRMKIFASACVLISMIMLCTTWVKFSGTMAYVTVMFDYPAESRKECDAILTEFLDNLSYDAS